jgi:hypothetical protein
VEQWVEWRGKGNRSYDESLGGSQKKWTHWLKPETLGDSITVKKVMQFRVTGFYWHIVVTVNLPGYLWSWSNKTFIFIVNLEVEYGALLIVPPVEDTMVLEYGALLIVPPVEDTMVWHYHYPAWACAARGTVIMLGVDVMCVWPKVKSEWHFVAKLTS